MLDNIKSGQKVEIELVCGDVVTGKVARVVGDDLKITTRFIKGKVLSYNVDEIEKVEVV